MDFQMKCSLFTSCFYFAYNMQVHTLFFWFWRIFLNLSLLHIQPWQGYNGVLCQFCHFQAGEHLHVSRQLSSSSSKTTLFWDKNLCCCLGQTKVGYKSNGLLKTFKIIYNLNSRNQYSCPIKKSKHTVIVVTFIWNINQINKNPVWVT